MARPSDLPDRFKPWAYLKGILKSAPLDLPRRLDQVIAKLRAAGWYVVIRSVGTDFAGPLGIPIPKDQPIEILIHRTDRPYSAEEAEGAMGGALSQDGETYSPWERWQGEIATHIVEKTMSDLAQGLEKTGGTFGWAIIKPFVPWIVIGGIAYWYLEKGKRR